MNLDFTPGEVIRFDVVGAPETQGSKTPMRNKHTGKIAMIEGSKDKSQRHKDWRQAVAAEARRWQEQNGNPGLLTGPVLVSLHFRLTKPASTPKTKRAWPIKARSGDVDKLARSILDGITGPLLADDSQVVGLLVTKDWGDPPGVFVEVHPGPGEAMDILATMGWVVNATVKLGEQACTGA